MKDLINIYLIVDYKKFNLGVEFDDDLIEINLLEIISLEIESVYQFNSDFIDVTSLIVKRYLLYISLIANINTKRR